MNIWAFHLTGNISPNFIKYNHGYIQKTFFMTCTVDFLFYTGYINNSDQIADTCEACDRGEGAEAPFFYIKKA